MKKLAILVVLMVLGAAGFAQSPDVLSQNKPRIIIYDIISGSYDQSRARLLTDVVRSELFKTRLFDIIERGVVQEADARAGNTPSLGADARLLALGRAAKADKLLISSVEKFDKTIAISVRIVDVNTTFIDYSDNIFLNDENLLFDAIKESTAKIEFFYAAGAVSGVQNPDDDLRARWGLLKAVGEDLEYLVKSRVDPEEYLTIRQYDITFTPSQYVSVLQASIDPTIIKTFLQAGISYGQTEVALALGIVKLDRYRDTFLKAGYTFEDYLDAYRNNIMSVAAYEDFQSGYNASYLSLGIGGVADSFPIANATYTFGLGKVAWERYWSNYQRGWLKYSTDAGMFLLNGIAPTPYFQANVYFGAYPYYFKFGLGGFAEVILGGHGGMMIQGGIEVMEVFDFSVIMVPFGSQPQVSYTDLQSRPGEKGYWPIEFPYAGVLVTYKIPISLPER